MAEHCSSLNPDTLLSYVAKTLDDEGVAVFEDHLVGCAECQRMVRALTVIGALPRVRPRQRRIYMFAGGLLAAVVATLLIWPSSKQALLQRNGAVEVAPAYHGVRMRGESSDKQLIFDSAMAAYGRGEYEKSERLLKSGAPWGDESPPAEFFLGISQLMLDRNREAVQSFSRVVGNEPNAYAAEAHFYRAKANLRLNSKEAALADLRSAATSNSNVANAARRLLQELER